MKRLPFLLFAFFFQATLLFSQVNNKGHLSLTIGPAVPVGQFAKTNLYSKTSGFAKTGQAISLSFDKPIAKKMSFLINLSGQRNPINKSAFESSFSTAKIYQGFYFGTNPNDPPPQTSYAIYPAWKFEKSSWMFAALQFGAKAQYPIGGQKNFHFIISATAGAVYASSPDLKGSSITDTATAFLTQKKGTGLGLIYSTGCGFHYQLKKSFFLTSTVNYTGTSSVTFKNIKTTLTTTKGINGSPGFTLQQTTTTAPGKQSISSINLLIGVGISF